MKKKLFTLIWVTAVAYTASAQRFVTEVFPSYMVSALQWRFAAALREEDMWWLVLTTALAGILLVVM